MLRVRFLRVGVRARWTAPAVFAVLALAAPAAQAGIDPGTQFTPFASSVLTTPTPVKATDGRWHIAYELVLTNATPMTMRVSLVEVRDGRTRRALSVLSGRALRANMNPLGGGPPAAATTVEGSGASIVWLDVSLPGTTRPPRVLEHRIVAASRPPARPFRFSGNVGRYDVGRGPVVVGAPLGSGTWVANEGCCSDPTHHRRGLAPVDGILGVPQRFAIDFIMVDDRFRAWTGNPRELTSYPGYGQPVIAAASGRVVRAMDGVRDNRPQGTLPELPPITETVGNHVTIEVRRGVYLLYGHMVPGSVEVRRGQRVRRGQVLGRVGNSGNSSTPHLHFQVMTRPTFFPSDTVPYAFDRFAFLGRITSPFTDENLALRRTGALTFVRSRAAGTRTRQLPLDNDVVRFR